MECFFFAFVKNQLALEAYLNVYTNIRQISFSDTNKIKWTGIGKYIFIICLQSLLRSISHHAIPNQPYGMWTRNVWILCDHEALNWSLQCVYISFFGISISSFSLSTQFLSICYICVCVFLSILSFMFTFTHSHNAAPIGNGSVLIRAHAQQFLRKYLYLINQYAYVTKVLCWTHCNDFNVIHLCIINGSDTTTSFYIELSSAIQIQYI